MRFTVVMIPWLLAAMTLQVFASPKAEQITPAEVASAIAAAGLPVTRQQVMLLSDVVARSGPPTLKVESIEPWGTDRLRVRLSCVLPGECLPFYVSISLARTPQARAPRLVVGLFSSRPELRVQAKEQIVVRAGASALLLLEGPQIHIQLSVTCLESGSVGQTIRVVDSERHPYLAKVGSDGYLRGTL